LNIENHHIDELIGKYLAHETSREESALVESWIAQREDNRIYFQQLKTIFDRASAVKESQQFDTDAAWNKVRSKLQHRKEATTIPMPPPASGFSLFWKIAASIIVLLGVGFFAYQIQQSSSQTIEVVADKKSAADTLPDGSGVFLNKETVLAYTYDKKKKEHEVKLQGEAYFNIHHDKDKTFIVKAGDVLIKDIGTSFNVKAYPESNTIEVAVEEGEVMFYTENDSGVYLRAGGKGVYHKTTKTFSLAEAEPNVTAYKTKFFIFSGTDLGTVVNSLNDVYDTKIIIDKNLNNCRLNVSFNNENIEEIANVIAETLGLTVKMSNREIVLEGKGCEN
jgi:transmembrane sensor